MNTEPENGLSSGLLRALVKARQVPLETALLTERVAQAKGLPVHEWMLQEKSLNAPLAARLTAEMYNTPLLDLDAMSAVTVTPLSAGQIEQIQRLGTLPLQVRADRIAVAVADPCDLMQLQNIGRITGLKPFAVVVEADKLMRRLRSVKAASVPEGSPSAQAADMPDTDPAAAIRFVQKYLLQTVKNGASELHLEPQANGYRLRARSVQGMKVLTELPHAAGENINDMLKNQPCFELNTTQSETVLFDVLSLQSQHGIRRVLRRSVALNRVPALEDTGLNNAQIETARGFLQQTQGRICAVSADDASLQLGLLYALAGEPDAQTLNIFTLESPIAGALDGCTQITMQSFNPSDNDALLASCLQQSPDILMINAPEKYLSEAGLQKALAWACLPGHCLMIGVDNALQIRTPKAAHRLQIHVSGQGQDKTAELILHAGHHG